MALDDYGYYDENGKFVKFKARKYRRRGCKTYHVGMDEIRKILKSFEEDGHGPFGKEKT